jgi:hypothetical protein
VGVQTIPLNIMEQHLENSNGRNNRQNCISSSLENITDDLITPKQAWESIKIGKTRFYTLVGQGYINLLRFDYSGRKTFVRRSELALLFPKDFIKN